ncbi:MAG: hypothetical protein U9N86_11970 [Bacteroidota bacterium]|nr:hypothetical protein [Bacteroidota bacterium]
MIDNLKIVESDSILPVLENALFQRSFLRLNEQEFALDVKDVAQYYVRDGKEIHFKVYEQSDKASVDLYLEGSVLGALLHQRGILPFHGSSFLHKGKGIMICGHSGVGKSSLTMSFCQKGDLLINDDISPVLIDQQNIVLLPLKTRIKLWDNTLEQLQIPSEGLTKIRPDMNKYYLEDLDTSKDHVVLDHLIILGVHNKSEFVETELKGTEKYNALRIQVYRRMYLKGMPKRERIYFKEMLQLARQVKVTCLVRPQKIKIQDVQARIKEIIEK